MDEVRVGLVGAGGIGLAHADALSKIPGATIVGIVDVNEQAAVTLAAQVGARCFSSAAEIAEYGDLDAMFILLPPFAHGEAERAALDREIPFFVEKPVGLDRGFLNETASEVKRREVITAVGYMNRYRKGVQRCRELLKQEPGILAYGGWWAGTPGAGGHWWPDKAKSGGQFHEQVTHTVDLARYFLGEATEVYGAAARGFVKDLPGYSMDDAASVTIRFESGAVATLMSSVSSNASGGIFLNLHSMNRTYKFRGWEHSLQILERDGEPEEIVGEPDIFTIEDAAFIEAVRRKDQSLIRCDYADGVKTALLSLAANRRIESGKPVTID